MVRVIEVHRIRVDYVMNCWDSEIFTETIVKNIEHGALVV